MSIHSLVDSGAGIITMTDSTNGNRLNPGLIAELKEAFSSHADNNAVRFILLRSNGNCFCHGMDLDAFNAFNSQKQTNDGFRDSVMAYSDLLNTMHRCSKTVVGLVQGTVKAGGVGVSAACDVVVADENASFELSELYLGLIPANVMPYVLSMRMPFKRAAYLVQTAACIDAQTALCWGLVDEVHSGYNIEKALKSLGRRLMRISPMATARQKNFANALEGLSMDERRTLAVNELVNLASTAGIHEAVQSFADGDLPPWFDNFRPSVALSVVS